MRKTGANPERRREAGELGTWGGGGEGWGGREAAGRDAESLGEKGRQFQRGFARARDESRSARRAEAAARGAGQE